MAELGKRRRLQVLRLERFIRRSGCFILVEPDMKSLRVFGFYTHRVDRASALIGPPGPRRKHLVELLVDRALPRAAVMPAFSHPRPRRSERERRAPWLRGIL